MFGHDVSVSEPRTGICGASKLPDGSGSIVEHRFAAIAISKAYLR
jgi:hypothetical protein